MTPAENVLGAVWLPEDNRFSEVWISWCGREAVFWLFCGKIPFPEKRYLFQYKASVFKIVQVPRQQAYVRLCFLRAISPIQANCFEHGDSVIRRCV